MDLKTGAIAEFETEDDAKKAGYTVPLSKELAGKLREMTRQERLGLIASDVATAAKFHPLAKLAGMADKDIQALRNAAKRARRERRK